ncbi:hypothetical protein DEM27_24980 [Metarhizobium album]|uniref:Uncharacterized protein n=1 Tax=Metarhizobium album TaxID=2182425 RepID=A0A2U2DJK7_9HYPH|nr:hypothetical protein [Rhizobium album]PWE53497.1 hypothetical protein DEM27_24980 [Rhizobium album]
MTVTTIELKISDILDDPALPKEKKIAKLQKLEEEARALQRAATESPMVDDDGWQSDLRLVEKALGRLGEDTTKTGAATL